MQEDPRQARFPLARAPGAPALALALAALLTAPAPAAAREILLAQNEDAAEEPPSSGPPPGVEVLRVRGRGIGGIQTEVPASVTSFDAATIEALGAQDVSDLSRVTPNVNIVQPGATQANFFIRGIGLSDFSANSQGAVTIFQDDVSLNAPAIQTGQLFDIGGVDIVRGPQGSGPFRNASAGAIRVNSNLPSGNYGARLRASIGRYAADGGKGAHHGLIQDYEGSLETPLAPDLLSTRLAFRLRRSDPYQTNGCGNNLPLSSPPRNIRPTDSSLLPELDICGERGELPGDIWPTQSFSRVDPFLDRKVDFEDNWAARGSLRLNPPESDLDLVLNAHGSRLDQDQAYGQAIGTSRTGGIPGGPFFGGTVGIGSGARYLDPDQEREVRRRCEAAGCAPPAPVPAVTAFSKELAEGRPLDEKPYRGDYNKGGFTRRDAWGGYARAESSWRELDLFFLASVDAYERDRDQDTDFTPEILFEVDELDEAWQTYEEFRIGGELAATPFAWELGGYYLFEALESDQFIQLFQDNALRRIYSQDTHSWGAWGEFAWDLLDDLTLEGGVRWNWERKEFEIRQIQEIFGSPFETPVAQQNPETWAVPTGTIGLTYHLNERARAFLKYSRGFKAGHFNSSVNRAADLDPTGEFILLPEPAEPESNDSWEAGLQGAFFDGRLSMLAAFFYYRYQDYQVFLFRDNFGEPPALEILNASEAENYGVELEGRLEPLRGLVPRAFENLLITWNASWLHGEFLDFNITTTFQAGGQVVPFVLDFSGDPLLSAPEYKFSGSLTWTFELGRFGYLIPRYDVNWSDDVFFGLNEGRGFDRRGNPALPDYGTGQKDFWLHNVALTYRTPTTNVEVAIWMRNVTDEVYKTFAFDASVFSNVVLNFVGQPRTLGVDVTFRFP